MPYKYAIAIDFKASCSESVGCSLHDEPEIFEIAAVLINLETGKRETIFHKYIKSVYNDFKENCTALIGQLSHKLNSGISLDDGLRMFEELMKNDLRRRNVFLNNNCEFVTWTDWDLKTNLRRECERKGLNIPKCLNKWIDLSSIHRRVYRCPPKTFVDALEDFGMAFAGTRRSFGIDNANDLAILTFKMLRRGGVTLSITSEM